MRELTLDDTFKLSEILDKMNVQADINKIFDDAQKKGTQAQQYLGGQLALLIVKSMYKAKTEVYELLSALTDKSVDDLAKMKFKDAVKLLSELFNQEGMGDFFKSAVTDQS